MKNQRHVFWQALIVTIFIFGVGILLGVWMENLRSDKISEMYINSEIELLDIKIQTNIFDLGIIECEEAVRNNIVFADKIYFEAIQLSKYEDSNKFTNSLILQHKRYDLLRILLWMNSMKIKEQCGNKVNYINVVYFYEYKEPDLNKKAKQAIFSKVLEEIKENYKDKVILIPIAGDLDITSLNLLKSEYNIGELPCVLINEEVKITKLETSEEIIEILESIF